MSVSIQVTREHFGLRFRIAAGRDELENRHREAGIQRAIPQYILITFDNLQDCQPYLGEVRDLIPLLFGITPHLGIRYEFVNHADQPFSFTE